MLFRKLILILHLLIGLHTLGWTQQYNTNYGEYSHTLGGAGNSTFGRFTGGSTTGSSNTIIGYAAGVANTTGSKNVFLGSDAGGKNNIGNENIFAGYYSGYFNTSGYLNTFIGTKSGQNN